MTERIQASLGALWRVLGVEERARRARRSRRRPPCRPRPAGAAPSAPVRLLKNGSSTPCRCSTLWLCSTDLPVVSTLRVRSRWTVTRRSARCTRTAAVQPTASATTTNRTTTRALAMARLISGRRRAYALAAAAASACAVPFTDVVDAARPAVAARERIDEPLPQHRRRDRRQRVHAHRRIGDAPLTR